MNARVLIVDDESDIRFLLREILEDEGMQILEAAHSDAAIATFNSQKPDLVILDIWLENSDLDGMELLKIFKKASPDIPILMISGHGTIENAVKAINLGAFDFLEKPFGSDRLILQVKRALDVKNLTLENTELKRKGGEFSPLIGNSPAIQNLRRDLENLKDNTARVMFIGDIGSGRKQAAQYLAELNGQTLREVYDIEDLIKVAKDTGNTSPILLQSIENLSADDQTRLLAELRGNALPRLFTTASATLEAAVINGTFAGEVFERLSVQKIHIPALADRAIDVPDLCTSILGDIKCPETVIVTLQNQNWSGNVSELKLVLQLAQLRAQSQKRDYLELRDLGLESLSNPGVAQNENFLDDDLRTARDKFESQYLQAQMRRHNQNVSTVAKVIGMDRAALHRKLKSLEEKE